MNKSLFLRLWLWAALLTGLFGCAPAAAVRPELTGLPVQIGTGANGFTRATGPRDFTFPKDHGPHNDTQTEWWYYTGNLAGPGGERYGFQLTFFRRAVAPPQDQPARSSDWAIDQVYLAHFAFTQIDAGKFQAEERLERGAAGLAGATGEPNYSVWLHDWKVLQTGPDQYHLHAATKELTLDLDLRDQKGVVLQGDQGYSRKGDDPGNASYYYSLTRLETSGTLELGGKSTALAGLSWMDHEFSTSALTKDQVGWDWFALQLEDGSELMVYTIRRADGGIDAYSRGIFVEADGTTHSLRREDFQIQVKQTWRSPHSGAVYPAAWSIQIPGQKLELDVRPAIADQELTVSFTYWEGAVTVSGKRAGKDVQGRGYTELTGYARSMQGDF